MDDAPVQYLDSSESWDLLQAQQVGRLAVVIGGEPHIIPINHVVVDEGIVFRTGEGSKLLGIALGGRVAYEVDSWDGEQGTSVVVQGVARELEGAEREAAQQLPLKPWVPTRKSHYVRIDVDTINGRQFHFGPEDDEAPQLG